MDIYALNLAQL